MQIKLTAIILLCAVLACKEKNVPADKNLPVSGDLKQRLIQGDWTREFYDMGPGWTFNADGRYDAAFAGPGGERCSSTFSIQGEAIQLEAGKNEQGENSSLCIKQVCRLLDMPKSLFSTEALACGSEMYYNAKKLQPAGKEVTVDGQAAVMLAIQSATLKEQAVLRAGPVKTSGAIQCTRIGGGIAPSTFYLVARTKEKVQVDNWNNYWYYVYAPNTDAGSCDRKFGWFFAEFVKPENQ